MHRIVRFCLMGLAGVGIALAAFVGCEKETEQPVPPPPHGPVLAVANQAGGAGNLSLVTLQPGAVQNAAAGLGITPNDIIFKDDRLYVINSGSHDMNVLEVAEDYTVTSIDTVDLGIEDGRWPQHGAITDNGKLYVSNLSPPGSVSVLDLEQLQVSILILVGRSPADVMAIGNKVYVCNSGYHDDEYDPGTVSVISTTSNSVEKVISVGVNPQFMALDPSGRLHVVCTGDYADVEGVINIINTEVDTVVQVIQIGGQPGEIAIAPNGIAYVAAGGWEPDPAGKVYSYHSLTGEIYHGPDNPIEVGLGAMRIVAADDNAVYVACFSADRVYKIVGDTPVDSYEAGDEPGPMMIIE